MKLGMIGLGKMGMNLVENLLANQYEVVAFDLDEQLLAEAKSKGATTVNSLAKMVAVDDLHIFWSMVPSGKPTEAVFQEMKERLTTGDIFIDGGNSNYHDSVRRAAEMAEKNIDFLDAGTSGGTSGANQGACTMVGGDPAIFQKVEAVFQAISVEGGYLYTGVAGSGHYLKMVHNGIEYGMMQAIAEGFEILENSPFDYDYEKVAHVFNHGSVVRSWLMELAESAFAKDAKLDDITGKMFSSGEGQWTVEEALSQHIPTPVIALSVMMRYRSLQDDTFSGKVVAALRNEFGGHAVEKK